MVLKGKVLLNKCKVISIIKDQQPLLFALLQPTFDCGHEFALVLLASGWEVRKQVGEHQKTGYDRLLAGGIDPERMGVASLLARSVGIFDRHLGLTDAAESLDG